MSQEDLFKHALNLQNPWQIKSIEFSNEEKRLDIHIDFEVGSRFECAVCKTTNCTIHDTKERVWRHLNFSQFKHVFMPECRVQNVKNADQSGRLMFPGQGEALVLLCWAQNMPIQSVDEIIDEHDARIWRVLSHYIPESRSEEEFSSKGCRR